MSTAERPFGEAGGGEGVSASGASGTLIPMAASLLTAPSPAPAAPPGISPEPPAVDHTWRGPRVVILLKAEDQEVWTSSDVLGKHEFASSVFRERMDRALPLLYSAQFEGEIGPVYGMDDEGLASEGGGGIIEVAPAMSEPDGKEEDSSFIAAELGSGPGAPPMPIRQDAMDAASLAKLGSEKNSPINMTSKVIIDDSQPSLIFRFDRSSETLRPIIDGMRGYDLTRYITKIKNSYELDMLKLDMMWYRVYPLAKLYFDMDPPPLKTAEPTFAEDSLSITQCTWDSTRISSYLKISGKIVSQIHPSKHTNVAILSRMCKMNDSGRMSIKVMKKQSRDLAIGIIQADKLQISGEMGSELHCIALQLRGVLKCPFEDIARFESRPFDSWKILVTVRLREGRGRSSLVFEKQSPAKKIQLGKTIDPEKHGLDVSGGVYFAVFLNQPGDSVELLSSEIYCYS